MFFKRKPKETDESTAVEIKSEICTVESFSKVGGRKYQEDRCGYTSIADGKTFFAVLADGMGGLSKGDVVSELILTELIQEAKNIKGTELDLFLYDAFLRVNEKVNQMLGSDGIYKSGSTLLAVLADKTGFRWLSVGDSRIYLFRGNTLIQINEEHNYGNYLMNEVLIGRRTPESALNDSEAHKLTSFIGMGEPDEVDYSRRSIPLINGDRVLLMSDGVFGTVDEKEILQIMLKNPSLKKAAEKLETAVKKKRKANQDNYSAVIMEFCWENDDEF